MPAPLQFGFQSWCAHQQQVGRLRHASSVKVYQAMWTALADWCAQQPAHPHLAGLDGPLLLRYLDSRNGLAGPGQALTVRYRLRLLALVRRVQAHDLAQHDSLAVAASAQHPAHRRRGAAALAWSQAHLAASPAASMLPPEAPGSLGAAQCDQLIDWLLRAPGASGDDRWRKLRDRCALALQLGAGLGPGDLRALRLADVQPAPATVPVAPAAVLTAQSARPPGVVNWPATGWWLLVPANGNAPAYPAPVAAWAAGLLQCWLACRSAAGLPGLALFPSTRSGKPWGKVAQYNSACQSMLDAGLPNAPGGSFRLRHTFALRQLVHGHSADTVATWLGVTDPQVMQRYRQALGSALIDHAAHAAHAGSATPIGGPTPAPWPV